MPKARQILVVDDEVRLLSEWHRLCRGLTEPWHVTFAAGTDGAWTKAKAGAFDVIVAESRMAGKDGFELLKLLRKSDHTRDIPVILLTGAEEHVLKRRALDLGATDLLNRPVVAEDLVARIGSALRLKSCEDQLKVQNDVITRTVRERTIRLEEARLDIVYRLAKAGEFRDEQTGGHVLRVGRYTQLFAEAAGMDRVFSERIFLASLLHDIGKIGVSDMILLKPGRLTPEERALMEKHCLIGEEILTQKPEGFARLLATQDGVVATGVGEDMSPELTMAAAIAGGHHEWWNGTGYPRGLAGDKIPLAARMTALADTFDALCSDRPYRRAYDEDKAIAIMKETTGTQFDPELFTAFEKVTDMFRAFRAEFAEEAVAGVEEYG